MEQKPVVLYVEDDAQSRRVMSMLLKGRLALPFVTIWENSSDFPERIKSIDPKPDVIFLDIHMDPYDGFEMLDMLRQHGGFDNIPIIALTASVMNEEIQKLKMVGFNGCLAKPLDLITFPDTLNRILAGEFIWRVVH